MKHSRGFFSLSQGIEGLAVCPYGSGPRHMEEQAALPLTQPAVDRIGTMGSKYCCCAGLLLVVIPNKNHIFLHQEEEKKKAAFFLTATLCID
jgi:hypothetical protein